MLIFTGLNFAGYSPSLLGDSRDIRRWARLGAGLLTAVTINFPAEPPPARPLEALAIGTVAACAVLVPRVLVVILVLNSALFPAAAVGLGPIFLAGGIMVSLKLRHPAPSPGHLDASESKNPLQLWSAIQMAIAFQLVISLLTVLTQRFGEAGVLATAGVLGLTDMDALTFGMSRLAEAPALIVTAAKAVTLGMTVNSAFKAGLAMTLGSPEYRRFAVPRLLLLAAVGVGGFWLIGRLIPAG